MPIQLLVSVRNAREAVAAVAGGADIVDIKEPEAGPLGFAGKSVIQSVIDAVGGTVPVSAALGESTDWLDTEFLATPGQPCPTQPLHFVKVGLAGLANSDVDLFETNGESHERSVAENLPQTSASAGLAKAQNSWINAWLTARAASVAKLPVDETTDWVAVAYSDADRANSPSPFDVLDAAEQHKCAVFLLDTFVKDGKTTLDWLNAQQLVQLRQRANAAGILLALAGQLTSVHVAQIQKIRPDILAVRGAVCDQSERTKSIDAERVRKLKAALS